MKYSVRAIRAAYNNISNQLINNQQAALIEYNKSKYPNLNAPEVKRLNDFEPSFMDDVEEIVLKMQSAGSQVVLVTLPGLFIMEEKPSELALTKGHLPATTDNPYVLAKLAEQYNIALRQLAKEYDLQVIDLEQWSKVVLRPRDAYFLDAVHLYEDGQMMIGVYMAEELYPTLKP